MRAEMNVLWIGREIGEEISEYVYSELNLSGRKVESEVARRAILFTIRLKQDAFQKAWKDGLLEYKGAKE